MSEERLERRSDDSKHARHEARLDRLEGVVEGIATNQARLESSITNMSSNIDRLIDTVTQNSRTNWGNYAAWSGVILIVAGLVVYQPLTAVEENLAEHIKDGHPHTVIQRVEDLEDNAIKQDDWMLEHNQNNVRTSEKLRALEKVVEDIRAEQLRRTQKVYKTE